MIVYPLSPGERKATRLGSIVLSVVSLSILLVLLALSAVS